MSVATEMTLKDAWHFYTRLTFNDVSINEDYLEKVLSFFEKPKFFDPNPTNWHDHLIKLVKFERCLRNSKLFSLEKTITIFSKHIQGLKQCGFSVATGPLYSSSDPGHYYELNITPIGLAAECKAPALLLSLIKAEKHFYFSKFGQGSPLFLVSAPTDHYQFYPELTRECIEILIKYGCDPNEKVLSTNWDSKTEQITPLWNAARYGHEVAVNLLVEAKADINFETNEIGGFSTPLQIAVGYNNLSTVELIIKLGGDQFVRNKKAQSALDIAVQCYRPEIKDFLIKSKVILLNEISEALNNPFLSKDVIGIIFGYLTG